MAHRLPALPRAGQPRWVNPDAGAGIRPHRTPRSALFDPPPFAGRVLDVVGLYAAPPERVAVFACDGMEAGSPNGNGGAGRPLLENGAAAASILAHRRRSIAPLFTAVEGAFGDISRGGTARDRDEERLRFMRTVEHATRRHGELHVLLDNYASLGGREVRAWLEATPRVTFHFLPTPSSWLDLVDHLLSKLTEGWFTRFAVTSEGDLDTAIRRYLERRWREPRPFVWIAPEVDRGGRLLNGRSRAP